MTSTSSPPPWVPAEQAPVIEAAVTILTVHGQHVATRPIQAVALLSADTATGAVVRFRADDTLVDVTAPTGRRKRPTFTVPDTTQEMKLSPSAQRCVTELWELLASTSADIGWRDAVIAVGAATSTARNRARGIGPAHVD